MTKRCVVNPIRRYKDREKLTYPSLAERLGISEDYARKLGSDGVTTVAPRMAMQFEARTSGAISYRDVMRWVYDRAKSGGETPPEPEVGRVA